MKNNIAASRKPNSVPTRADFRRREWNDDHSSSLAITGEIERPTRKLQTGRLASPDALRRRGGRSPIWSCSVRGFACHRPYGRRGALLPLHFTLTGRRLTDARRRRGGIFSLPLSFRLP